MARIYSTSSEQEFIQVVSEITSEVYDPLEPHEEHQTGLSEEEEQKALKRFEFLENQLETIEDVESEEYLRVQEEMMELEAILQDPQVLRWLRCLEIIMQLLKLTSLVGSIRS